MTMAQREKLQKFGPGPWVDEPDHVEFKKDNNGDKAQ